MKEEKNRLWHTVVAWLVVLLIGVGCQGERHETPTKGSVTIVVSESVLPLIKEEEKEFEELYPEVHVTLQTATAREAITRLFNDSITIIVSSRPLNAEERDVVKRTNLLVHEYKIALDGVAVIVNNANPVARLRTTQLDSMLNGTVTNWKEIDKHQSNAPLEVCLPNRNSGIFETVAMKVVHGGKMATPSKVANSSEEMVQFVSEHEDGIGVIGVSWLGEGETKEKVKVLELNDPNAPDSLGTRAQYFSPHQAYLYQQYYPLTKEVYIISRADNYGVAAGFTSFITSAPGQKIVVKNGLAPATMPVRLVELTNRSIQQ